jgi:hypothetical protein
MSRISAAFTDNRKIPFVILGHLSFLVLFIFAFHFFRERILFSDTAFQFFKIVNFEKINVEASRYGAIMPQIPVLLAMQSSISLKGLTILFSASFILLYYLVFIVCTHLLKNKAAGLAVVLVLVLNISQSFFHPVTETHQSLVFVVLFYAIIQYSGFRNKIQFYSFAIFTILLAFFTHPIAIYPLVFITGYVAIDKEQLRSAKPYILLLLIIVLAVSKVLLTDENSYEGKFFSEFIQSPAILLELPNLASTKFFIKRLPGLYFWLGILEIALIVYLVNQKRYKKLIWQLLASGFFLIVSLLTYSGGDSDMLMERAFMPLALFVAVPLLRETMQSNKNAIFKVVFLILVIGFSMNRIFMQGRKFQQRTAFNLELLSKTAQFQNRKFIIQKKQLDKHVITFWSNSFETLILSAITEGLPTQTVYAAGENETLNKYVAEPNTVFLGASFWLEWNVNDLNSKYFDLPERSRYKVVDIDNLN